MSRVLRQPAVVDVARDVAPARPEVLAARAAELEAVREEAWAAGRVAGLREGREQGRGEVMAQHEHLATMVVHALDVALAGHRDQRAADAAATVELALRIAREVAGATIDEQGHALAGRVRSALALVDDTPVVIRVAPQRVEQLAAAFRDTKDVSVEPDDRLGPDEARASGPWSDVDLGLDARWAAVAQAVRG